MGGKNIAERKSGKEIGGREGKRKEVKGEGEDEGRKGRS